MAHYLVFQHIERGWLGDAASLEHLNGATRKATHRELGRALHEKHHVAGFDELVNALLGIFSIAHGEILQVEGARVGTFAGVFADLLKMKTGLNFQSRTD